jgi:uncharacterized protein YciI
MFVVLLKFSTQRSKAGEWMEAHKAWLQQGFDDAVFMASGSLQGQQGGCILAQGLSQAELAQRLAADPFVIHDVVKADVIEFTLGKTDPRLQVLMGPTP